MFSLYKKHKEVNHRCEHSLISEFYVYEIIFEDSENKKDQVFSIGEIRLLELYNPTRTSVQWKFTITFKTELHWNIFQMLCDSEKINTLDVNKCIKKESDKTIIALDSDSHKDLFPVTESSMGIASIYNNMSIILAELIQEENFERVRQYILNC